MLQHRDDEQVDEFDDEHASEVSSDEDMYYQTVAVGGRQGKLDCAGGGATEVHSLWTLSMQFFIKSASDATQ